MNSIFTQNIDKMSVVTRIKIYNHKTREDE